jgi:hypothetical protein
MVITQNSLFEDNFSINRASVAFADFVYGVINFMNCTFRRNYAINGGLFFV